MGRKLLEEGKRTSTNGNKQDYRDVIWISLPIAAYAWHLVCLK
jgi:hypothetical protein